MRVIKEKKEEKQEKVERGWKSKFMSDSWGTKERKKREKRRNEKRVRETQEDKERKVVGNEETLNKDIEEEEARKSLKLTKKNKAAEQDELKVEFLGNLLSKWMPKLRGLLNEIASEKLRRDKDFSNNIHIK